MAGVKGRSGGKRVGSGRVAGTPNKATAEIKAACQIHGAEAVKVLVALMRDAESEQTRLGAIKELLDRGYGKARQPVVGGDEDDNPIDVRLRAADEFTRRIVELAARTGKT